MSRPKPHIVAQTLLQAQQPSSTLSGSSWGTITTPAEEAEDEAAPKDGDKAADAAADDTLKDIDVAKLDWSQLNIDPTTFLDRPEAGGRGGKPASITGGGPNWSNQSNANGSAGVAVKQTLSPFWDARIGADMTVARPQPATMSELLEEKAENGGGTPQSGGTAWAAVTAPGAGSIWDKTAIEARIDPAADQSKIGATITKAVPLDGYNLSLQNGYNVTQQGMVPLPGAAPRSSRSFDTEQSARLAIGDSGATLSAGQTLSSSDDKWLRKVGAEQKLTDHVTVSGAIGETAQGTTSKSITAGFKKSW